MLAKLDKIKNWQAAGIISTLGLIFYSNGLNNYFVGDDFLQIVNNPVVHSLSNFKLFYEGGTFYLGKGIAPLYGVYFRPLMTTVFSALYTAFGPHPFYFHLAQLSLALSGTFILYLFFKFSFRPVLALALALIFLLHPMDSQTVYAIASMQDVLYFFFGIFALYLLVRLKSDVSLIAVAACLFLSLLAKETGVLFVLMAGLYLLWFDRTRRLLILIGGMIPLVAFYLVLKTHAIGLIGHNPGNTPIDYVGLGGRLMTAPSIVLFYITKVVFPLNLASGYYWVHDTFGFRDVLLPAIIDLIIVAASIVGLIKLRKLASKPQYYTCLFFAVWALIGLVLILQIIPLDMTTSVTWFYFSMAGLLGLVGETITIASHNKWPYRKLTLVFAAILILTLGIKSSANGSDWRSSTTLAYHDIKVSQQDYNADNLIASQLYDRGQYQSAKFYAQRSVSIFPFGTNQDNLGLIDYKLGEYPQAEHAYQGALKSSRSADLFENIGTLFLQYGKRNNSIGFVEQALDVYPKDANLWFDLAVLEYQGGNVHTAQQAISLATQYSSDPTIQSAYSAIMNGDNLQISK